MDYLSDLKKSQLLIERIKSYYISQGISTRNMKFVVEKGMDSWGTKIYSIRSNLIHDCKSFSLKLGN